MAEMLLEAAPQEIICQTCGGSGELLDTTKENYGREWKTNAPIGKPCYDCRETGYMDWVDFLALQDVPRG